MLVIDALNIACTYLNPEDKVKLSCRRDKKYHNSPLLHAKAYVFKSIPPAVYLKPNGSVLIHSQCKQGFSGMAVWFYMTERCPRIAFTRPKCTLISHK